MGETNKNHKDRLFRFIFGSPEHKDWTLSLYNAVNQTHYTDPEEIELTTIQDALYMGMKNDVSFLVTNTLNFYEHQSGPNPNMPVRLMIYAGMVYSRWIQAPENKINLYSTKQQKLPAPRFVCFYNGLEKQEDEIILRLSDSFPAGAAYDLEATVRMLNINHGRSRKLLEACKPLGEYSEFVWSVREKMEQNLNRDAAVAQALRELPDDYVIKPYLMANRAEVTRMCITEYDEALTMELFREEYLEEGREQMRREQEENNLRSLRYMRDELKLPLEKAMDALRIPTERRGEFAARLGTELQGT